MFVNEPSSKVQMTARRNVVAVLKRLMIFSVLTENTIPFGKVKVREERKSFLLNIVLRRTTGVEMPEDLKPHRRETEGDMFLYIMAITLVEKITHLSSGGLARNDGTLLIFHSNDSSAL